MTGARRLSLVSSIYLFFLFTFFSSALSQAPPSMKYEPPGEPIRLRADHIAYDKSDNSYLAEGNVEVWQGDRKLTADRVRLNAGNNEAEATGNVILVQGEDVLRGERIHIDLDTSLGIIFQGTLFLKKQHFYLRGEEIERVGEDTYRVKGGSFTTCDGDWPSWRFTGRETLVTLEEYASVRGATFEVKNVPLVYSPYLFFPVKTQRQSGFLIPRVGYSNTSGFRIDNAFFWAISKNMDATFYLDLAERKGVGEGLEYRYIRKKGSSGVFHGYHLRESEAYREKYTEQLDRQPDRWQVDLQHEEYFSERFFAKTRITGFSDRQYFKDYGLTYEDRASEQAYSFVSLTHNWERFSLFAEARHTVNLVREDKTTLQNYPLITFTGLKQQIFASPFYYSFNSTVTNFWREEGVAGQLLDVHPRLSLPLKWKNYVEITPELGARETFLRTQDGGEEFRSRGLWDLGVAAATDFSRTFDTGWEKVPKLKHQIRPEIAYTYIPDYSIIPDVDQRQIPDYGTAFNKSNPITYSLTQRLIGKVFDAPGKSRYHEFVYLKVGKSYDLHEAGRSLDDLNNSFQAISAKLRVKSLKYFMVENITAYDPDKNRFLSTYTLFGVTDSRGDTFNLEYRWERGIREQINGGFKIKILPTLDVSYGKRYSGQEKQSLETLYAITYHPQCWSVELSYSEKPGVAGQPAEKKTLVMFNLVGLTSMGKR